MAGWNEVKIENIKADGIELAIQCKVGNGISFDRLINYLEVVQDYNYGLLRKELKDFYGLDYDKCEVYVKMKGNKLMCILPFKGRYEENKVKSALKAMGIK